MKSQRGFQWFSFLWWREKKGWQSRSAFIAIDRILDLFCDTSPLWFGSNRYIFFILILNFYYTGITSFTHSFVRFLFDSLAAKSWKTCDALIISSVNILWMIFKFQFNVHIYLYWCNFFKISLCNTIWFWQLSNNFSLLLSQSLSLSLSPSLYIGVVMLASFSLSSPLSQALFWSVLWCFLKSDFNASLIFWGPEGIKIVTTSQSTLLWYLLILNTMFILDEKQQKRWHVHNC